MDLMVLYRLEPLPSTTYVASVQGQPTKPITAACSQAGLQPGSKRSPNKLRAPGAPDR